MIEDDLRFGKGAREIAKLIDLGMVESGIEGQAEMSEDGEPFSKGLIAQQAGRRAVGRIAHRRGKTVRRMSMRSTWQGASRR